MNKASASRSKVIMVQKPSTKACCDEANKLMKESALGRAVVVTSWSIEKDGRDMVLLVVYNYGEYLGRMDENNPVATDEFLVCRSVLGKAGAIQVLNSELAYLEANEKTGNIAGKPQFFAMDCDSREGPEPTLVVALVRYSPIST
jgi:hypothetical protein